MKHVSILYKITCTLLVLVAVTQYVCTYMAVPSFLETFASFGAELPLITNLVARIYPLFAVIALFSFLPLLAWLNHPFVIANKHSVLVASIINAVVAFVFLTITLYAMYVPIFSLGEG